MCDFTHLMWLLKALIIIFSVKSSFSYHPCHWHWGVVCVEVRCPPYSLLLNDVGALVGRRGGHHVVGRVGGVTPSTRGRRGVRCDLWGVQRRRSSRQRHT